MESNLDVIDGQDRENDDTSGNQDEFTAFENKLNLWPEVRVLSETDGILKINGKTITKRSKAIKLKNKVKIKYTKAAIGVTAENLRSNRKNDLHYKNGPET